MPSRLGRQLVEAGSTPAACSLMSVEGIGLFRLDVPCDIRHALLDAALDQVLGQSREAVVDADDDRRRRR